MAEIPGAAYAIIGGVVVIASLFMEGMLFFTIVGGGLVMWGVFRMAVRKKPARHAKRCPRCHRIVHENDNFCAHCGQPLKYHRRYPHFHKGRQYQHSNRDYNHV